MRNLWKIEKFAIKSKRGETVLFPKIYSNILIPKVVSKITSFFFPFNCQETVELIHIQVVTEEF